MKKENVKSEHDILYGPGTDLENDMPTDAELKSNGKKEEQENFFEANPNKEVQVQDTLPMQSVSINNIADLDTAEVAPVDLMSEYWTPTNVGEVKRMIFDKIDVTPVLSNDGSGELIELECAFFLVNDNGSARRLCNGSKRLVGSLQSANVKHGMALQITYLGKKQNASNGFKSDNWSVKPLVFNKK